MTFLGLDDDLELRLDALLLDDGVSCDLGILPVERGFQACDGRLEILAVSPCLQPSESNGDARLLRVVVNRRFFEEEINFDLADAGPFQGGCDLRRSPTLSRHARHRDPRDSLALVGLRRCVFSKTEYGDTRDE